MLLLVISAVSVVVVVGVSIFVAEASAVVAPAVLVFPVLAVEGRVVLSLFLPSSLQSRHPGCHFLFLLQFLLLLVVVLV